MTKIDAINKFAALDLMGVFVFTKGDLAKAFPEEKEKSFEKSMQRLVSDGILQRVAKGVYLYRHGAVEERKGGRKHRRSVASRPFFLCEPGIHALRVRRHLARSP